MPAPLSPSSDFSGPSGSRTAHVLWVARAYFFLRLSAARTASTAARESAGAPLTAYFDPRSEMTFSI